MCQTYYAVNGGVSLPPIALGLLDFLLLVKCKLSVPKVIGISAILGIICFGVLKNLTATSRNKFKKAARA